MEKKKQVTTELKVTSFNANTYEQYLKFRKKIKDFKSFIKNCLNEMEEEDDNDLYKFIRENYYLKYNNIKWDGINEETNSLYFILCDALESKGDMLNNYKKEVCYLICQIYQVMKKNYSDDERYEKSNTEEFFTYVITQFNFAKSDLDDNFKTIYINNIKNLVYNFELINCNLLGNNISRNTNIDKTKN